MEKANTPFARPITFEDLTLYVTSAMELYVDLTSRPSIANITSTISPARYALQYSGRRIVITSTTAKSIVTITTPLNLRNDVTDAKQQS
jgi:hypothetical protein